MLVGRFTGCVVNYCLAEVVIQIKTVLFKSCDSETSD
jgi:hypothetical protein